MNICGKLMKQKEICQLHNTQIAQNIVTIYNKHIHLSGIDKNL